jgi:hypothetical protein
MKVLKGFLVIGLLVFNAGIKAETLSASKSVDIVVYRSPSCHCCGKWLEHLKQNNFVVKDIVTEDVQAIKNKYGVFRSDGFLPHGHSRWLCN